MRRPAVLLLLLGLTACGLLGGQDKGSPEIPGKIVFSAADDAGTLQIYKMNADGSNVKKLTDFETDGGAVHPSWSPDGSRIVFSTTLRSSSNGLSLYIMDADGSNMRPMNEREGSDIPTPGNHPRWSPGGNKIAFDRCVNCQASTNHVIYSYEFNTDSLTQLTEFKRGISNTNPTWSPDGSHIAFTSDRDYVDADTMRWRKDLYVMDADGSNLKRLTEVGAVGSISWHSKGNRIAFATDKGLFIYAFQASSIVDINIELKNLRPIRWYRNGRYLLLSKTEEYPKDGFYLLDTREDTVKQISFRPRQLLGADWFVPKEN